MGAGGFKVRVTTPDRAAALSAVRDRLRAGRGFALATINLDHLVKLRRDAVFAKAYAAQDIVVADGNPVVWLSRLARRPVSLVPGSELVIPLARLAAEEGAPVALVGSTAPALAAAGAAMERAAPGLEIVTRIAPPMGFDPDSPAADALFSELNESGARLTFLALGAPKQERLAARGRRLAPRVGFASIGAGLDFLAGTQRRAPRWVQAVAMEWLWRMLSSPARLGPRYARCAAILPGEVMRAWRLRSEKAQ
nr:WecB/TagA/CpsF family glycosyltransferase [Rhodosalinus halophilus]